MRECLVCKTDISHKRKSTVHCSMKCAHKTIQANRYPDFNENYFAKPNLENSYWAGFIAADGCIVERPARAKILQISLKSTDKHHLIKLQSSIGKGAIYDYSSKVTDERPSYHSAIYQVGSNKICDDLERNFNITPRKTFSLKPPKLTGDLAHAFIAGYIDGDGCYHKNTNRPALQALGTREVLYWILKTYGLEDRKVHNKSNVYEFWISGRDAILVRESFQALGLPLLERKINRWEDLGANLYYE